MKLGVVADQARLPDSPDAVVVVEPSIGSVARTKGSLYLLVTSRVAGSRAREAARLAVETIRNEYYYDESAGIRDCLRKSIDAANKRLAHARDRYGLGHTADGAGPIGIAVAVVRGHELYVATVGPAEAYLIRQARLSTLPDPHRDRGLPAVELEPDVWRGEISVGDSLVLISPNIVGRLGPSELKDAMLTLHPQAAIEHLHGRFVAAEGTGSDGAIAIEAMETTATQRTRTLVPVRPAEPLAGAPDRSPIPLADPVAGGVAAVQASARQAREAAGGAVQKAVGRVLDVMPARSTAYRRVTPLASRRERQRRAALAILAFIVVLGSLSIGISLIGPGVSDDSIASQNIGQDAIESARTNLTMVAEQDLVEDDQERAVRVLVEAYEDLDTAAAAGIPATSVDPLRAQVEALLDRLYGVIPVRSTELVAFDGIDLTDVVRGPDGAPYILDRATDTVYRVRLSDGVGTIAIRAGSAYAGEEAATPVMMTVGGPDLIVVDARNVVWRWRPADETGTGTASRIRVNGASAWGENVRDIGTFLRNADRGLYNLYVINPLVNQILAYAPAADGSGFPPPNPSNWLAADRDVASMRSMVIDGDIYVIEGGEIQRFVSGRDDGWAVDELGDALLREAPRYTMIATADPRREGVMYAFDALNRRIVAFDKPTGDYLAQYRLAGDDRAWTDLRAFYVEPGEDDLPDRLIWIGRSSLHEVVLERVPDVPGPTPRPTPSLEPSIDPDTSGEPAPVATGPIP
jgi:hypothetical protein